MPTQLPLGVYLRDDATLESFFPGEQNVSAIAAIYQTLSKQGDFFLYLWGKPGVGRSHLLQGACQQAQSKGYPTVYLPLSDPMMHPDHLEGLESLFLVCLDDIQAVLGQAVWEEALFHFYNRLRDRGGAHLIVTGDQPVAHLPVVLPDLKSRLAWGAVYQVHPLSELDMLRALQLRASQRGLVVSDEVGSYVLKRCARTMSVLYEHLDTLDKASMGAQHKLTIPFVKRTLKL